MTIQTAFRLDKKLVSKLKKYCESEGRSQTWVANKAFSDYLGLTQKGPIGIVSEKKPVAKKAVAVVVDDTSSVDADRIIDYLNSQAGTKYQYGGSSQKHINARLKNYSVHDVCTVIKKKCLEWKGGSQARYLRPSTLFNATRFEEYLNQDIRPDKPVTGRNTQDGTKTKNRTVEQQLNDRSWA